MLKEIPITTQGKERIEKELNHLITIERENLKRAIAEARELGDLRENAEYHAAKDKQSHVEGRISQLQGILAASRAIDVKTIKSKTIVFGATIVLRDLSKDTTLTYQIVGDEESDISQNRISYNSPLGKALIGKEEGDTVIVKAPKGNVEYEIDSFEFI